MPPRRSTRKSTDNAEVPTNASISEKRSGRQSDQSNATPRPAKHQKTARASNVTAKTSPHFKKTKSIENTSDDDDQLSSESSEAANDSEFETAVDHPSSDDEDDADDFTEDEKPKPKKRKAPAKGKPSPRSQQTKHGELWRDGAGFDLEPGTEIIIKKPKARPAGKTPYKDDTIHPNTMLFLKDLKANNDREWLKMHDPDYRASLQDWTSFVERLTEKLTEIDETIPELPVKDIVFRIYRDIRFSKDPTPYKTYYSAAWSRTGRKGPYGIYDHIIILTKLTWTQAAYYLQIAPGNSFIGGGCWFPEAQYLAKIRDNIDRRPHKLKNVLSEDRMRKEFLSNVKNDPAKVVKAFVSARSNAESALKTKPKVAHLNSVVMPDGDESDSDDRDDQGSETESDAS
ncbi:hypothetical protein MBLNU457_g0480t2 [Dothideomycetes sp. NU457]